MNIGAVSAASGVSQRMIRHYEKIGLIPAPPRRDSGYRVYSRSDVHRLRFIANARDLGFQIEDIRELLALWADRDRSSSEVKALALARAAELRRKVIALNAMESALHALAKGCSGDHRPDCPIIDTLSSAPGFDDAEVPDPPHRSTVVRAGRRRQARCAGPEQTVQGVRLSVPPGCL